MAEHDIEKKLVRNCGGRADRSLSSRSWPASVAGGSSRQETTESGFGLFRDWMNRLMKFAAAAAVLIAAVGSELGQAGVCGLCGQHHPADVRFMHTSYDRAGNVEDDGGRRSTPTGALATARILRTRSTSWTTVRPSWSITPARTGTR
jgi:hypothetical protein